MKQLLELYQDILDNGFEHADRTGRGRISVHGRLIRYDLTKGFPLVTTKKMHLRGIMEELFWFIRGSTDNNELVEKKVSIWNEWAVTQEDINKFVDSLPEGEDKEEAKDFYETYADEYLGSIGNLYGKSWREAPGGEDYTGLINVKGRDLYNRLMKDKKAKVDELIKQCGKTLEELDDHDLLVMVIEVTEAKIDQLGDLIYNLKNKPYSSRHVISAWIPQWIPDESRSPQENVLGGKGALAPCHCLFQFHVSPPKEEGGKLRLSCQLMQRSTDCAIGKPYNVASYAAFTMMVAQVVGMEAFEFIWVGGDTHIYPHHVEGVKEQLKREPYPLPTLKINPDVKDILDFKWEDFVLEDYQHHETIQYEIAV